ncbi:MAG: hypothetical protein NUV94_02665 [Candidatus Acetothermia bacterium]|jgi:predicted RNA-binding protein YlqC (UPF0109 family)|nr:hypothetical protein [Candidatus Acetothermia bacterium]
MLAELARYLLRAVSDRPAEVQVDHVWSAHVDFLFLRVPESDQTRLSPRDRDALARVIETVGARTGRTVMVDWR